MGLNEVATSTIQTLTAEVRTLVVGSRQVTLSVYKQLDNVRHDALEPFGRVHSGKIWKDDWRADRQNMIEVVGCIRDDYQQAGSLARASMGQPMGMGQNESKEDYESRRECYARWHALPLIVLAGLR
jgi:hypothetical protein